MGIKSRQLLTNFQNIEKKLPEQDDQEDGDEGGDDGYYMDAQEEGVEVVEYEENQEAVCHTCLL